MCRINVLQRNFLVMEHTHLSLLTGIAKVSARDVCPLQRSRGVASRQGLKKVGTEQCIVTS